MNINDYYAKKDEKPLDVIKDDGGFCSVFRTIACIGDSLSSGELQTVDSEGVNRYYDLYEHSWGQYMARMTGSTVYNFSRGGMTAKEYCEGFADSKAFWSNSFAAQAYVIALGVNDLINSNIELGTTADLDLNDWNNNKETFAGYYGKIIQRMREISPGAVFFLMTMPQEADSAENAAKKEAHAKLLYDFADMFDNTYVLDFYKYSPVQDREFKDNFWYNGHMTPSGYLLTAKMVASYIDFIIRKNMKDFRTVGFIGTGIDPHNNK